MEHVREALKKLNVFCTNAGLHGLPGRRRRSEIGVAGAAAALD